MVVRLSFHIDSVSLFVRILYEATEWNMHFYSFVSLGTGDYKSLKHALMYIASIEEAFIQQKLQHMWCCY